MKLNQKPTKSFFGSNSKIITKTSKEDSEYHGDFFLYNSIDDERELHQLLDAQIKQSMLNCDNYED